MINRALQIIDRWRDALYRCCVGVAMLVLPAIALLNAVGRADREPIAFGRPLAGATQEQTSPAFSLQSVLSGEWQRAVARAARDHLPVRPFLVRLNNEILYAFFGELPWPAAVIGRSGHLALIHYINDYCRDRRLSTFLPKAKAWVADLKAIQQRLEARHKRFLYAITPSKVAAMPDEFVDRQHCPGAAEAEQGAEIYDEMLRDAGVHFVNAAAILKRIAPSEPLVWPVGGVHWTYLGAAYAGKAIMEAFNAIADRPVFPTLAWTVQVSPVLQGPDRDVADLLNLRRHGWPGMSPVVRFRSSNGCPQVVSRVTIIGGSFSTYLVVPILQSGCVTEVLQYMYLDWWLAKFPPGQIVKRKLAAPDLRSISDDGVIILEENEAIMARSQHGRSFRDLVLGLPAPGQEPVPEQAVLEQEPSADSSGKP